MKKIGFIDYYLKEWHADNYPTFIKNASKGELEVCYAWGKIDAPDGTTSEKWCKDNNVELVSSIEELVEKSDYIIVLSPDNCEMHEELCQIPLRSGKRVYVDKTFAPSKKIASDLFAIAKEHNTKMFSTSSLRYSKELPLVDKSKIDLICSIGDGTIDKYLIHQLEPICILMGTDVKRMMFIGTDITPSLILEFTNGKKANITLFGWDCAYSMVINNNDGTVTKLNEFSDFMENFVLDLVRFFNTGEVLVDSEDTIAIMGIWEKAIVASNNPGQWIQL